MKKNYFKLKKVALVLSLASLFGAADVNAQCTVTASSSASTICQGGTVSITGGGATSYTLSNGVASGAAFTPNAPGTTSTVLTYTVEGSGACGTGSTAISITVNPVPVLTITATSPTLCSGSTTTLTANGGTNAATYTWSTPGAPTGAVISLTPAAQSGSIGTIAYSVTVTSAKGCTATAANIVTVTTTPIIAPLASPSLVCSGGTTTLQTSGANSYTWLPTNETTSLIVYTPATVTTISQITFTVTKANGTCSNTQTIGIQVNPLPIIFAVPTPTAACAGQSATLTAGGALNFTWTPATAPGTGANIVVSPTTSTTYTYSGYDGTCTATSTLALQVNPVPTLVATASPTTICAGFPSTLTATGANTYTWSATAGTMVTNLTGAQVVVNPLITTNYNLQGTNQFNCTSTISQPVYVNPLPNLTINPTNTLICIGRTVTLIAGTSPGASTYIWDANVGNGSVTTNTANVSPTVTTVYSFTGTSTQNGCPAVKSTTIAVFNPTFSIPTSAAVCFGSTVALVSSGAVSYTWLPGNAHTPSISVNPTVTTSYSVAGTRTIQNNSAVLSCSVMNAFTVTVNANPTLTAVADHSVICRGETTSLTATSQGGATSFTWTPAVTGTGSVVVAGSQDDESSYVNTVTYSVTGANANNCKHTTTVQVITTGCVGIENNVAANKELLIFPNPSNGEFTVKSDNAITLSLVNQVGQVVKTITLSESNGHKATVSDVASGIYFMVGANENGRVSQKVIINK